MKRIALAALSAVAFLQTAPSVFAAPEVVEIVSNLPAIFKNAEPTQRMSALTVARKNAERRLIERIYGLHLNANTTIYDLVLQDDVIRGEFARILKGHYEKTDPKYYPDGRVDVNLQVKLRQFVETIKSERKETKVWGNWVTLSDVESFAREKREVVIDEIGTGALVGSDGMKKLRAYRAAQMDAYRRLVERVVGVQISSDTKVANFMVKSDVLKARASALIKGAKELKVQYDEQFACQVTMELRLADVIEVVKRYAGPDEIKTTVETRLDETVFVEKGEGAPNVEEGRPDPVSVVLDAGNPYGELVEVIERHVGTVILHK